MSRFIINYDQLPISNNNYLRPSATYNHQTGKVQIHMYETKESKDFKKRFKAYLKREVVKQKWDVSKTEGAHWYLDCIFYQARTNQDNNNMYKILCDSLSGIVTKDDKNILVRTQRVMYDSKEPRFVAVLKPVEYIGIFKDQDQHEQFINTNCSNCKKNSEKCTILRKAIEGRIQPEIHVVNRIQVCEKKKV